MTEYSVDHHDLDEVLRQSGSSWSAGQAHGLLCSRLAVAGASGAEQWFELVLAETSPENALRAECEDRLERLCAITWRQLVERQSEFELLLPDDDDSTVVRAEAMAHWCEGFLHGLVSEKHNEELKARLAADPLADIIRDMLQITRAASEEDGVGEDEESAWVELVEYLRVATQLTYEELADLRSPDEDSLPDESSTLH